MHNARGTVLVAALCAAVFGQEGKPAERADDSLVVRATWELIRNDVEKGCADVEGREWNVGWYIVERPDLTQVLAGLLALQLPERTIGRPESLMAVTAMGGQHAYRVGCACEEDPRLAKGKDAAYVVLWNDGTVRGEPWGYPLGTNHTFGLKVHTDSALGDVVWVVPELGTGARVQCEVQFDGKGIVPLGFVLGDWLKGDGSILHTFANACAGERWKKDMPYTSYGDTAQLLASSDVGDVLRGLYNVENEDRYAVGRAGSLLAHRDPRVRARTAAILANDPVACNAVLPLHGDSVPRVSATAHLAALSCANVEEARNSFVHLLGKAHSKQLFDSCFDFERLRDAHVALRHRHSFPQRSADHREAHEDDDYLESIGHRNGGTILEIQYWVVWNGGGTSDRYHWARMGMGDFVACCIPRIHSERRPMHWA